MEYLYLWYQLPNGDLFYPVLFNENTYWGIGVNELKVNFELNALDHFLIHTSRNKKTSKDILPKFYPKIIQFVFEELLWHLS